MPVRRLTTSDEWFDPPDQLLPREGVFRAVKLTATGASPDMLLPMPELTSPPALIHAHPEKHLVELSPFGRVTISRRGTVQPTNGICAILEHMALNDSDTGARRSFTVPISAQRIGCEETAPLAPRRLGALPLMASGDWSSLPTSARFSTEALQAALTLGRSPAQPVRLLGRDALEHLLDGAQPREQ